jgi:ubiquinone/menaquinone biosynthesis C-methylase UbiE
MEHMAKKYEIWDKIASKWDENVSETKNPLLIEYEKAEEKKLFEIIQNRLRTDDLTIIEIGCGTGRLLLRIADAKLDAAPDTHTIRNFVGVDVSGPMLEIARKNASDSGCQIGFVHADAREVEKIRKAVAENTKVIVFCPLNTLGIFLSEDRPGTIAAMAKLAGINGTVFVSVFNAVAFEKNAYEIYVPVMPMVGQFDRKAALDLKTNTFRNGDYFSHWFLEGEIRKLVEENFKATPLEDRKLKVQKVGDIGILVEA